MSDILGIIQIIRVTLKRGFHIVKWTLTIFSNSDYRVIGCNKWNEQNYTIKGSFLERSLSVQMLLLNSWLKKLVSYRTDAMGEGERGPKSVKY